jgi:hypothetical protein
MFYSTPNYYLGLYDSEGWLLDEARFGEIGLELLEWTSREIHLCATPHDVNYFRTWARRATRLGSYRLRYHLRGERRESCTPLEGVP